MPISSLAFRLARKAKPIRPPIINLLADIQVASPVPAQVAFNPPEVPVSHTEQLLSIPKGVAASKGFKFTHPEIEDLSHTLAFPPLQADQNSSTTPNFYSEVMLPIPGGIVVSSGLKFALPSTDSLLFGEEPGALEEVEPPEIESFFIPISHPSLAGRSYTNGAVQRDRTRSDSAPRILSERSICRHGIDRRFCQHCNQVRQPAHGRKTQAVDVFSQLWFVLQPPILERLDKPDVLPNGKKPYDFQVAGIKWLLDAPRALLADEMGLGKTIQAIMAMRVLFQRGELQKVLVVCPVSAAATWMKESREWAPELRTLRVNETAANRPYQWRTPAEVYVVSYDMLRSDVSSGVAPTATFDLCIIDEAQNIKNPSAQRTRAVKQVQAKYRWALTGTPLENSLDDAISIFDFLNPHFIRRIFEGQRYISAAKFRSEISPYTLRRTVSDVELELPELTNQEYWLELAGKQRTAYDNTERFGVSDIRGMGQQATRIHVLALISKLKQICNLDETSGHSCKLDFLQEQLNELTANGEKALVFSQYPNVTLKKISPRLQHFSPLVYDGRAIAS